MEDANANASRYGAFPASLKASLPMYVCICNALKCSQFREAAQGGAQDVTSAFKACGAKPRCGRCFEEAASLIEQSLPQLDAMAHAVAAE
jgi:bacterioferritin-associated ferredoxin